MFRKLISRENLMALLICLLLISRIWLFTRVLSTTGAGDTRL
jgi:hypothetical protein